MAEELDMPIDGEFEKPDDVEDAPVASKRPQKKRAFVKKRAIRQANVKTATEKSEKTEEPPRERRPRIAIEAATASVPATSIYKKLALSFLGATVLVAGVVVFFTFQRATITVRATGIPVATTFVAHVAPESGDERTFVGTVVSIATSTTTVFRPSQTTEKPGKAHGIITVINTGGAAQPLVVTTRFLSEGGILFRATKSIIVPANGQIDVEVAADKPGTSGDIPAGTFTIPGLNVAQQKNVYGKTSAPMTGGTSKIGVVSVDDLAAAEEEARKALMAIGEQVLADVKPKENEITLYTPIAVKAETLAKIGDEVGEFTVSAQGTIAMVLYPKDALAEAADRELQQKSPTPYHKVQFTGEPVVSLQTVDGATKSAELQIFREGKAVLDERSAAFQPSQFLGRAKQEIVDQIKSIQGVQEVLVDFFPPWIKRAPTVPGRIEVKIENK